MLNDTWDKRFLAVAKEISTWSKDPSKKLVQLLLKISVSLLRVITVFLKVLMTALNDMRTGKLSTNWLFMLK